MIMYSRLNLKYKLYVSFGVLIVFTLFIASLAMGAMDRAKTGAYNASLLIDGQMSRFTAVSSSFDLLDNSVLKALANSLINHRRLSDNSGHLRDFEEALGRLDPTFSEETSALIDYGREYLRLVSTEIEPALRGQDFERAITLYFADVFNYQNNIYALLGVINQQFLDLITGEAAQAMDPMPMILTAVCTTISVIISICVSLSISNYITKQIGRVVTAIQEVAHNNLSTELDIHSEDEFGILASSFRQMRDDLSDSVGMVVKTSNDLKKELDGLQSVSNEIAAAAQNAEGQAITVAAATNEMVATTADVANNCENAARIADDTRGLTNDSMSSVRSSVDAIQRQSVRTREDGEKIRELAGQTQKIGSIVATIDEIAAQTNLLALNAAIEAARAGEAGRGFAVVADEVRALASRTSKSTQEISSMVSMIQSSAMDASQSIADSVENFTQVADEAGGIETSLNQILGKVSDVSNQVTQISTAASEQTTATSEISTNMQSITSASQQITRVSNDAIARINHSITTLDGLLANLKRFRLRSTAQLA